MSKRGQASTLRALKGSSWLRLSDPSWEWRDSGLLFLVIICHQAACSPTIPCPQNALMASAVLRKLRFRGWDWGVGKWRVDKGTREGRKEGERGILLRFGNQGQGPRIWRSLASGGGRKVYCGESILGSDFHLLFICWVLFMLPAVSQSGGGACQGWGVCGSAGHGLGTISPLGSCKGTV